MMSIEVPFGERSADEDRESTRGGVTCLPVMVGHPDPELRELAIDELSYWAGDKYEWLGDLHGAADQFGVAASHGLGDAHTRLARVRACQDHDSAASLSKGNLTDETQRAYLRFFAALTMGGTLAPMFKAQWLSASDLAPWPVAKHDVTWVESCLHVIRAEASRDVRVWRGAAIAAVNWSEHLLGSECSAEYERAVESTAAELHLLAGWAASCDGVLASAREHFVRAAWLSRLCDDDPVLLSALFRSAVAYMRHHQPNEAIKYCQLAQILAADMGASRELIVLLAHQVWCYLLLGKPDQAAKQKQQIHNELHRADLKVDDIVSEPPFGEPHPWAGTLEGSTRLGLREASPAVEAMLLCAA